MPVSPGQIQAIAQIGVALERYSQKVDAAVTGVCQYYSQQGAAYAKENAPWADRTGDARKFLHGYVVKEGMLTARISHGVLYGIHLEKRYSGKYAILPSVKRRYQAEFLDSVKKAVKGATIG